MVKIPLTQGLFATIDSDDFEKVNTLKWFSFLQSNGKHYVATKIGGKQIRLHRMLLGVTESNIEVDHINGDPLDNRRSNLRTCTKSENQRNRGKSKKSTSGYKGVSFCRNTQKFRAQIRHNGKLFRLGRFLCPIEAALAYDKKAKELHGDFANLNFKEEV